MVKVNKVLATDHFGYLDIDWDIIARVLEEAYEDEVKAPTLVVATKRLKRFSGMHKIKHGAREFILKRPPRGADEEFISAVMHGEDAPRFYHEAQLSGGWLEHIYCNGMKSLKYFGLEKWYPEWITKKSKYITAVCIIHVLAHEMQHSIQTDGYVIGSPCPHNLTMCDDWTSSVDRLPGSYFHTPKEADAEIGAQELGPIIFERYAELVGWKEE